KSLPHPPLKDINLRERIPLLSEHLGYSRSHFAEVLINSMIRRVAKSRLAVMNQQSRVGSELITMDLLRHYPFQCPKGLVRAGPTARSGDFETLGPISSVVSFNVQAFEGST